MAAAAASVINAGNVSELGSELFPLGNMAVARKVKIEVHSDEQKLWDTRDDMRVFVENLEEFTLPGGQSENIVLRSAYSPENAGVGRDLARLCREASQHFADLSNRLRVFSGAGGGAQPMAVDPPTLSDPALRVSSAATAAPSPAPRTGLLPVPRAVGVPERQPDQEKRLSVDYKRLLKFVSTVAILAHTAENRLLSKNHSSYAHELKVELSDVSNVVAVQATQVTLDVRGMMDADIRCAEQIILSDGDACSDGAVVRNLFTKAVANSFMLHQPRRGQLKDASSEALALYRNVLVEFSRFRYDPSNKSFRAV